MNIIDILLILIIVLALWNGIKRGFIAGLAGITVWIGSVLITFCIYHYVSRWLETHVLSSIWTVPLAFIISLLVIGSILWSLVNRILIAIPNSIHDHRANKLLGFLPGAVVGTLYAAIISALLLLFPLSNAISSLTRASWLGQRLTAGLAWAERPFVPVFEKAVSRSINRMTIEPGSTQRVDLPFSVEGAKPRPDLEAEMLVLINEERAKANLPPLNEDQELMPVARKHSDDMFVRSYFSHVSPDGSTPFDRIRKADIAFLTAGENLAIAQTLLLAHGGLMNSPGHRANILRPGFGRVGIGILDGGVHGLMVTQKFRN